MMANISFPHELAILKKPVWRKIQKYLPDKLPIGHYKMVREYPVRQGKYFRPGLVLLATKMFGGDPARAILTAAAMQISEDWLLIHDDIEDHSLIRRGKPTLNELYGRELALNTGDALHVIMWKTIGDNARLFDNKTGWKIFNTMNDALLKAAEGQYLELKWIRDGKVFVFQREYLDMVKRKTAHYTVIAPLKLGALIAEASQKDIENIEKWGIPFGYAFQIWDDCMNLKTTEKKQGKEQAGDIFEGKRTIILSHLLEHCSSQERIKIEKIYRKGRHQKTKQDMRYVLRLMKNYGSIAHSENIARNFSKKAGELFSKHTAHLKETKAKRTIRAGIDFIVHREA
ncbi:MAG: polyprenyl synthetase family protein [Candidatus Nealsonbacteria bacterium]